ncbi:MAG: DUF6249 domain-containing protein [Crocinitomicaceae bacterium]
MSHIAGIIIAVAGCAMIFGIVYIAVTADNRENMAMIEAGMNPKADKKSSYSRLRTGMLFFFVPVGILIGNFVHDFFGMRPATAATVFAFLFGGLAMLGTYFTVWALGIDDKNEDGQI